MKKENQLKVIGDPAVNSTQHASVGEVTPPEISFQVAAEWTANWRALSLGQTQAQCFTVNEINQVLNVAGANGVRAYYGLKEKTPKDQSAEKEYIPKLFLVAVDVNGNDILPQTGVIVDFARPCPSYCGAPNILNSGLPVRE